MRKCIPCCALWLNLVRVGRRDTVATCHLMPLAPLHPVDLLQPGLRVSTALSSALSPGPRLSPRPATHARNLVHVPRSCAQGAPALTHIPLISNYQLNYVLYLLYLLIIASALDSPPAPLPCPNSALAPDPWAPTQLPQLACDPHNPQTTPFAAPRLPHMPHPRYEPENAKLHFRRGKALSLKGDYEEAEDALKMWVGLRAACLRLPVYLENTVCACT